MCAACERLKESHDGAALTQDGLICAECEGEADAWAEEAATLRLANPLEPGFRRLDR